jgi:drug/metabolite transporter (DMT)-like permease
VTRISRPHIGIFAAFAAIYLFWGATYLAVAVALRSIPPLMLMATRSIAGGLILLACVKLAGRPTGSPRTWAFAAACGVLFFVGCHGVLAHAQQHVPSGLAAVLLATIPFWIVIAKTLLLGSKPALKNLAVLTPGIAGVGLIAWQQIGPNSSAPDIGDIVLLLGASASWAIGTILSEAYAGSSSRIALSGMELVTGGLVLVVLSIASGELHSFDVRGISLASFGAWLYLVIAGTVLGFAAYIWLLKHLSPTLVSTYTFVNPVVAVLLGWLVLGEHPTARMLVGAALVVTSVVLLVAGAPSNKQQHQMDAKTCAVPETQAGADRRTQNRLIANSARMRSDARRPRRHA